MLHATFRSNPCTPEGISDHPQHLQTPGRIALRSGIAERCVGAAYQVCCVGYDHHQTVHGGKRHLRTRGNRLRGDRVQAVAFSRSGVHAEICPHLREGGQVLAHAHPLHRGLHSDGPVYRRPLPAPPAVDPGRQDRTRGSIRRAHALVVLPELRKARPGVLGFGALQVRPNGMNF